MGSREGAGLARRNLSPQPEAELMKYVEELTERKLPPTRETVQICASDIAAHPFFASWVSRFLDRHIDELTSQWSTSMDRQCHAAASMQPRSAPVLPNARRVEVLCRAKLNYCKIRIYCNACLKPHIDWFENSTNKTIKVIEKWSKWMRTCP
jgi:hypothetical protein